MLTGGSLARLTALELTAPPRGALRSLLQNPEKSIAELDGREMRWSSGAVRRDRPTGTVLH
jgi:hypothetical protein